MFFIWKKVSMAAILNKVTILDLYDPLDRVCFHLSSTDLLSLSQTCSTLREICSIESIYADKLRAEFNRENPAHNMNKKQTYFMLSHIHSHGKSRQLYNQFAIFKCITENVSRRKYEALMREFLGSKKTYGVIQLFIFSHLNKQNKDNSSIMSLYPKFEFNDPDEDITNCFFDVFLKEYRVETEIDSLYSGFRYLKYSMSNRIQYFLPRSGHIETKRVLAPFLNIDLEKISTKRSTKNNKIYSLEDLKDICYRLNLGKAGKKTGLVSRIRMFMTGEVS